MNSLSFTQIFNTEHLIHSLKTVMAVLIALGVTKIVGLNAGQWIIVTILVVMCAQLYVGSVLQKAYLRFIGTLVGCLLASLTIQFLGTSTWQVALGLGIASFIFSYIATGWENLTYAATLGAVTTSIILLGPHPTLLFAVERVLEISIGLLIASLVSQFILPIHARTHLRNAQALTLEQIHDYYQKVIVQRLPADFDYHDTEEVIVKSLLKQRQLAKESLREPLGIQFDPKHFMQVLYAEREILRSITFMHLSLHNIEFHLLESLPAYKDFNAGILKALETLSKRMTKDNFEKNYINFPNLQALIDAIQPLAQGKLTRYLNGYLFSAEVLLKSLRNIAKLYKLAIDSDGAKIL